MPDPRRATRLNGEPIARCVFGGARSGLASTRVLSAGRIIVTGSLQHRRKPEQLKPKPPRLRAVISVAARLTHAAKMGNDSRRGLTKKSNKTVTNPFLPVDGPR